MKKGIVIIIILILVLIIIDCGLYISSLTHQVKELSEYKDMAISNNVQEDNIENDKIQENEVQEDQSIDVEFVRTFIVKANLNYTDATGEYNFYAVDQFQFFDPIIIKVDKQYTLKENQNYEFTFKGSKIKGKDYSIRDIFDTFTITNIEKTNKVGLEQTQDEI